MDISPSNVLSPLDDESETHRLQCGEESGVPDTIREMAASIVEGYWESSPDLAVDPVRVNPGDALYERVWQNDSKIYLTLRASKFDQ